jgi:hypothetical protein
MPHSPGPWTTEEHRAYIRINGPDGKSIGSAYCERQKENARLMANAPVLLDACHEALNQLRRVWFDDNPAVVALAGVIEAATGTNPLTKEA